eukprot:UC1_evm1s879
MQLELSAAQTTQLKLSTTLCTLTVVQTIVDGKATSSSDESFDCFMSIATSAARDSGDNSVVAVPTTAAQRIKTYVPDKTKPSVTGFVLDLSTGIVTLSLSEPVKIQTFNAASVFFQQVKNGPTAQLSNSGTVLSNDDVKIELLILPSDLNKVRVVLGNNPTTPGTLIYFGTDMVSDMADNSVHEVSINAPMVADNLVQDTSKPTLETFSIDLTQKTLTIVYSEP